MPYSLREALAAFRRSPLLAFLSVLLIAFSLFVIGLFGLAAWNIDRAISEIEEKVEIVAYLDDAATPTQVALAEQEVAALPAVAEVRYVNKIEALATAMGMDEFSKVNADLENNPLPTSLEVRLRPGSRTPAAVKGVADRLEAYTFVEEVAYGREWLEKIFMIRRIAGGTALVIGGAFALVAAIIIATAVRIAVFARREEISIMRLVGATDGFVQRPFLLEGVITGLLGGVAAAGLTYAAYRLLSETIFAMEWLPTEWIVLAVLMGTLFGFISSMVAVRRHLEEV